MVMWQCELSCGHVAFAIRGEQHEEGGYRQCAAHEDRWQTIVRTVPVDQTTKVRSRRASPRLRHRRAAPSPPA